MRTSRNIFAQKQPWSTIKDQLLAAGLQMLAAAFQQRQRGLIDSLYSPIYEPELTAKGNCEPKWMAVLIGNRLCRIDSLCSTIGTKIAANGDRRTKRVGPFAGEVPA